MPVLRDFVCGSCDYTKDDFAEIDDVLACPRCGKEMRHAWLSAPNSNQLGAEGSSSSIAAMQQSFRERFVKKEMDDVRNKHGSNFDESLVSAEAARIRKDKGLS